MNLFLQRREKGNQSNQQMRTKWIAVTLVAQPSCSLQSTRTKIANILEGNAASFRRRHIRDDLLKRLEDIEEFELAHDAIYNRRRVL